VTSSGGQLVVRTWTPRGVPLGPSLAISPTVDADAVFLSDDGRFAAVIPIPRPRRDQPVRIWSIAQRRIVTTLPPSPAPFGGLPVFSPDDSLIAMGKPPAMTVAAAQPGNAPPTGGPTGLPRPQLVVVDAHTGKARSLGTTTCGTGWRSEPFSPNGKLLAAGTFCGQVYVWNVARGTRVGRPFSIGGELAQIAFSPDARRIAVASWNSTIAIADPQTGRVVTLLTDHTSGVADVAYSPDGRYLASASLDGTARIWDARSLRPLRVLHHPDPVYMVAFAHDSRDVVTTDGANVVRVWDACTACGDGKALLAFAASQVTRQLTAQERRTFLGK
jgi:WD40 repeat protein